MAYVFPSEEWINELKNQINASEEYRESGAGWEAGDICFVVYADPDRGLNEKHYLRLDLFRGECREAESVPAEVGEGAKFLIGADYDRWQQILTLELDPIRGMMMGRIKVKGDLSTLMKHTKAATDLLRCAARVPTEFLNEKKR
jgi:putative sterol carrier protein